MDETYSGQSKKSKKKLIVISIVAILLVCIVSAGMGGFVLYKQGFFEDKNIVATVGDEKIYLKDYNRMFLVVTKKETPQSPSSASNLKKLILDQTINLKIIDKELVAKNITISEDEITAEAKKIFKDYDTIDKSSQSAYRDYAKLTLGTKKLSEKVLTWKEGSALFCRFDRADQDDMKDKPETVALKEKQRTYADKYCQEVRERLEKKQSTFPAELARIKADTTIGESIWNPYSTVFGLTFNKERFSPDNFSFAYDEYEQIAKLKSDKEENYYLLTIKDKLSKEKEDAYFAVVNLKKEGNNGEAADIETWFKDKRSQYNVKTYIERIKE